MDVISALKALIAAAFAMGLWVAGIQFTINAHGLDIKKVQHESSEIKQDVRDQERKYIDVLGRIDERLKNIEKKTN